MFDFKFLLCLFVQIVGGARFISHSIIEDYGHKQRGVEKVHNQMPSMKKLCLFDHSFVCVSFAKTPILVTRLFSLIVSFMKPNSSSCAPCRARMRRFDIRNSSCGVLIVRN